MAKSDITIGIGSAFNGEGFRKAEQATKNLGSTANKASGQIKNIAGAIGGIAPEANKALNAVNKLGSAFAQGGVWGAALGVVTMAIGGIKNALDEAKQKAVEFAGTVKDKITEAADKASEKFRELSQNIKRALRKENFQVDVEMQGKALDNRSRDASLTSGYIDERKGMNDAELKRSRIEETYKKETVGAQDNVEKLKAEKQKLQNELSANTSESLIKGNEADEIQAQIDKATKMYKTLETVRKAQKGEYDRFELTTMSTSAGSYTSSRNVGKQGALQSVRQAWKDMGYSEKEVEKLANTYFNEKENTQQGKKDYKKQIDELQGKLKEAKNGQTTIQDTGSELVKKIEQKDAEIKVAQYEADVKVKAATEKREQALKQLEEQEKKEVEVIQNKLDALKNQLQTIEDEDEKRKAMQAYDDAILEAKKKVKDLTKKQAEEEAELTKKIKEAQKNIDDMKALAKWMAPDYREGESSKKRRKRLKEEKKGIKDEASNVIKSVMDAQKNLGEDEINPMAGIGRKNSKVRAELIRQRTALIEKYGKKDKNGNLVTDENGNVVMSKAISKADNDKYEAIKTALDKPMEDKVVDGLQKVQDQMKKDLEDKKKQGKEDVEALNGQIEKAQEDKVKLQNANQEKKQQGEKDKVNGEIAKAEYELKNKQQQVGQAKGRDYGQFGKMDATELMNLDPTKMKKRDKDALAAKKGTTEMTNDLLEQLTTTVGNLAEAIGAKKR